MSAPSEFYASLGTDTPTDDRARTSYFVYYLTVVVGQSCATRQTIAECFDQCDLPTPPSKRLNSYLSDGAAKRPYLYVRTTSGGYKLHRDYRAKLKARTNFLIDGQEVGRDGPQEAEGVAANNARNSQCSIFIVHGHDGGTKETVARFIERLGFEAIVLHERPNRGRTLISKFREEAQNVGYAVVIMTPDDHGGTSGNPTRPRARQNVVFELGFFLAALGPEKVTALVKGEIEEPSDYKGVVYTSLNDGSWKSELAGELEAAGFKVDWRKVGTS